MALKGIEKTVARFCVQTAVYWGNPTNDGFGAFIFAAPVEIDCRWEDKKEVDIGWFSSGFPGNIFLSKASVLVTQDLDLNGFLFRGELTDIDATLNPLKIKDAFIIHRFDRIPMVMKTDQFVRVAYLYDQGK